MRKGKRVKLSTSIPGVGSQTLSQNQWPSTVQEANEKCFNYYQTARFMSPVVTVEILRVGVVEG